MHSYESKREEEKKKCIGSFEGEVSHKEEVATLEKIGFFFPFLSVLHAQLETLEVLQQHRKEDENN